jgi:RNA polymerase sigma factor (sigma-70 family)
MQTRQGIIEIFSSFLQFDADQFSGWVTDARLRRSIKICCEQSTNSEKKLETDKFWAIYWHKVWQTEANSIAAAHLSAYLQEVCYWVAKKMALNFNTSQYSVSDCFQIAISRVPKILKSFNSEYSYHLKSYAELAFEGFIKDAFRLRREADICNDWALLHKVSRKRLVDGLTNAGFNSQIIESYVLAWECFQELHTTEGKKTRQLVKPDVSTLEAITNLYNRQKVSQLSHLSPTVTSENLEKWLSSCGKAVRDFLYPKTISADTPIAGQETGSLLDILPANAESSLLAEVIFQEEQADREKQHLKLSQILTGAVNSLDTQSQKLLEVYYLEQLTQQEIAEKLDIKQYTVSRRLSSIKRSLLLILIQWSVDELHISPTPNVLDAVSKSLDEWLNNYYSHATHKRKMEPS